MLLNILIWNLSITCYSHFWMNSFPLMYHSILICLYKFISNGLIISNLQVKLLKNFHWLLFKKSRNKALFGRYLQRILQRNWRSKKKSQSIFFPAFLYSSSLSTHTRKYIYRNNFEGRNIKLFASFKFFKNMNIVAARKS